MSAQTPITALTAQIARYRDSLQLERDADAARDVEIRRLRGLGWSYARIGAAVGVCHETARNRALAMGLTDRAKRYSPCQEGMTPAERQDYLIYRAKRWTAAEARAAVLRSRRKAA